MNKVNAEPFSINRIKLLGHPHPKWCTWLIPCKHHFIKELHLQLNLANNDFHILLIVKNFIASIEFCKTKPKYHFYQQQKMLELILEQLRKKKRGVRNFKRANPDQKSTQDQIESICPWPYQPRPIQPNQDLEKNVRTRRHKRIINT